jgi:hypothetical protein
MIHASIYIDIEIKKTVRKTKCYGHFLFNNKKLLANKMMIYLHCLHSWVCETLMCLLIECLGR